MYQLSALYDDKFGFDNFDNKLAVKWYKKAAEKGHDQAQFSIGQMYYEGRGVKKDYKEAARWFNKAAEVAMTRLGSD